jgi:hypothetical protein
MQTCIKLEQIEIRVSTQSKHLKVMRSRFYTTKF